MNQEELFIVGLIYASDAPRHHDQCDNVPSGELPEKADLRMESPETWDLLTSSLAISNLAHTSLTWAFLVVQGLVRDELGDRETFGRLVENVTMNPVTGPSDAARVALSLKGAGIAQPDGLAPDPWARVAAGRLAPIESWTGRDGARRYLETLEGTSPDR